MAEMENKSSFFHKTGAETQGTFIVEPLNYFSKTRKKLSSHRLTSSAEANMATSFFPFFFPCLDPVRRGSDQHIDFKTCDKTNAAAGASSFYITHKAWEQSD